MDDISARIGELTAGVESLRQSQTAAETRQNAAHADIAAKLRRLDDKLDCVAIIKQRVEINTERINSLEATAEDYKAKKNKVIGAAGFFGVIGGAFVWAVNKLWPG